MTDAFRPEEVPDLWFPGNGHWESRARHGALWDERMQGGMDTVIAGRFGPLTEAAAKGLFEHWAETPGPRLALLIALDQGPDHLARFDVIDALTDRIGQCMPAHLAEMMVGFRRQNARVLGIIARFGRHPHRNPIYGRVSTPGEEAHIAEGNFPHMRGVEEETAAGP